MKRRVFFAIDSTAYLRHILPVIIRFLEDNSFDVEVYLFGFKGKLRESTLKKLLSYTSNVYVVSQHNPRINYIIQQLASLVVLLHPKHTSPQLIHRSKFPQILKNLAVIVRRSYSFSLIIHSLSLYIIRTLNNYLTRRQKNYKYWLRHFSINKYELIYTAPFIFPRNPTLPLQLACVDLKIPLFAQLASWDNLSTKGTWFVKPNKFYIWNKFMKTELDLLHSGISPQSSFFGSPTFEDTLDFTSSFSRSSFLEELSLPPNSKYILYMCSSPTIGNQNEILVIRKIINSLRESGLLDECNLIVRTHPLLDIDYSEIEDLLDKNVVFYPRNRTSPNLSANANLMYLSTIQYSECVIGLNTSAFLDCCILDRPCITLPSIKNIYDADKFGHINLS